MVELHTGTNFPAVSLNSLLAAAMMKHTDRWNGTGVPTQSIPQAASFTLSAYNNWKTLEFIILYDADISVCIEYSLWLK